jgi:prevent-host-death family protein
MTKAFNIHEAKTHFSKLVDQAAAGKEIVIAKAGKPVAKLVSVDADVAKGKPRRKLGMFEGKYNIPDDFDAPLPEDVLDAFYEPLSPDRSNEKSD